MKPNLIAFCVCLIALVPAPAAVGAPLEAYGRLPALENLSLSPDGKELAYVTGYQGDSAVVVYDIDSAKVTAGINVGHVTVRNVRWADNDNILVTASSVSLQDVLGPKTARFVAQIFTVSTKSLHPLMIGTSDSLNVIYGVPVIRVINGRTIAFVHGEHFVEGRGQLTFFAIDIGDSDFAANRVRLIQQGNPLSEGWIVDQNGNVVAAVEYNESNKDWVLNLEIRNRWVKAVDVVTPIDIPTIEGFSADGRSLIVRMLDKGSIAIKQVSLADGSVTEMANAEPYLAYPIVDERTGRVVGHVRTDSTVHYAFLDGSDQARWNSVVQAFPGETVELVSASSDKKRVVVRVDGPRS